MSIRNDFDTASGCNIACHKWWCCLVVWDVVFPLPVEPVMQCSFAEATEKAESRLADSGPDVHGMNRVESKRSTVRWVAAVPAHFSPRRGSSMASENTADLRISLR
jgi:hypothetical protein